MIKTKIKDMFKKTNIFIEFILSILLSVNILNVLYNYKYKGETNFIEIILIIAVAILILSIIIYNIIKNKGKLEIYFLIFMIPIGIMYQIFLMPNYVPDELMHMYKSYDVSQGNIITKIDKDGDSKIEVPFILATGFNMELFQDENLMQRFVTYTIVTNPLKNIQWKNNATIHDNQKPYHYLRKLPDDRLIFGGEDIQFKKQNYSKTKCEKKYDSLYKSLCSLFEKNKNEVLIIGVPGEVCINDNYFIGHAGELAAIISQAVNASATILCMMFDENIEKKTKIMILKGVMKR